MQILRDFLYKSKTRGLTKTRFAYKKRQKPTKPLNSLRLFALVALASAHPQRAPLKVNFTAALAAAPSHPKDVNTRNELRK